VTGADRWLLSWNPPRTARTLLVCLPHAGSGAYQYRPWQESLGPEVALLAVQLPGWFTSPPPPVTSRRGRMASFLMMMFFGWPIVLAIAYCSRNRHR
jgi:hypothetical protein